MGKVMSLAVLQTRMVLELPGCPEVLRVQALMDASRAFCKESEAWREDLDAMNIVTAQVDYNLIPTYDANIHRLEWVKVNTAQGVTDGTEPEPLAGTLFTLTPGDPDVLTLDDSIEPTEDITGALTVRAILVPEFNSLDIAEWFANRYWSGIVSKAKAILMMSPNKRWTNPTMAAIYEAEYRDQIADAKGELRRQYRDDFVGMEA